MRSCAGVCGKGLTVRRLRGEGKRCVSRVDELEVREGGLELIDIHRPAVGRVCGLIQEVFVTTSEDVISTCREKTADKSTNTSI
jgi:hypothetical protein